jgi:hypothetical protein
MTVIDGGRFRYFSLSFLAVVLLVLIGLVTAIFLLFILKPKAIAIVSCLFTEAMLLGLFWSIYIRPKLCTVTVSADGKVMLELDYLFRELAWAGTKSEILRIAHVTYDAPEADVRYVNLEVTNVGAVRLHGWNLFEATLLGNAIDRQVDDVQVKRRPQFLNRSELTDLLAARQRESAALSN